MGNEWVNAAVRWRPSKGASCGVYRCNCLACQFWFYLDTTYSSPPVLGYLLPTLLMPYSQTLLHRFNWTRDATCHIYWQTDWPSRKGNQNYLTVFDGLTLLTFPWIVALEGLLYWHNIFWNSWEHKIMNNFLYHFYIIFNLAVTNSQRKHERNKLQNMM